MSVNKNSTYGSRIIQRITYIDRRGYFQTHSLHRLQWRWGWLARWQKKESRPSLEMDYELSDESYAEGGHYHDAPQQAALERMIELNWVSLRMKRNL